MKEYEMKELLIKKDIQRINNEIKLTKLKYEIEKLKFTLLTLIDKKSKSKTEFSKGQIDVAKEILATLEEW